MWGQTLGLLSLVNYVYFSGLTYLIAHIVFQVRMVLENPRCTLLCFSERLYTPLIVSIT